MLVSAASNAAVDNLGERLVQEGIKVIRIGHPAKCSEGMIEHLLSQKVKMEIEKIQDDIQDKEKLTVDELSKGHLLEASVVLGTLIGCRKKGPLRLLPDDFFKTTVIDECGQSLEMACWIVIPRAPRLILAGDHHQLPPTVITKNQEAAKKLSVSLMERLRERFLNDKNAVFHMLKVRMTECIFND